MKERLLVWIAALWWGSLTTVGFGVVPMLFIYLPTPAMAGTMAAKLFAAQTWMALVSGLLLLMYSQTNRSLAPTTKAQHPTIFVVAGMMLALLSEFVVAPKIVARENLAIWHSVGTLMYALQWFCAAMSFGKLMAHTDSR